MNYSKGLAGVIAGETSISQVEGDIGRLSYRGFDIRELSQCRFEDVAWLVLMGEMPDEGQRALLSEIFLEATLSDREQALLRNLDRSLHPMLVLQGMLPLLDAASVRGFSSSEIELQAGLGLIAKMPLLIAAHRQLALGQAVNLKVRADTAASRALALLTGLAQKPDSIRVFETIQILQMEHSFNASTFATRVVGSTLAPVASVLSAGVGALYGKLHGGADEAALLEARQVGQPDRAEAWVDELLAKRGKLMGMGHREYRKVDPRAEILKPLAQSVCKDARLRNQFDTLVALEAAFNCRMLEKGKEVWANIEFYKGAALDAVGIPTEYFTAVFACSRAVGWLAHLIETRPDNRIIRPKARYTGLPARSMVTQSSTSAGSAGSL